MPFQSEKQRRYLHANHPEIAKRWEEEYATGGISNHFRKRYFSGAYGQGAGDRGGNPYASRAENIASGHVSAGGGDGGGGGGGGGPKPHSGPTAAELAVAAAAAKKAADIKAHKEWISKKSKTKKKKVKHFKKIKDWAWKGDKLGKHFYKNVSFDDALKMEKKWGYNPNYTGKGALYKNPNLLQKYATGPLRYLSNALTSPGSNIAGATPLTRMGIMQPAAFSKGALNLAGKFAGPIGTAYTVGDLLAQRSEAMGTEANRISTLEGDEQTQAIEDYATKMYKPYATGGIANHFKLKNGGMTIQGGVDNWLGEQETVSEVPIKWKSQPGAPETELAYITKAEKDLILKKDIHGSLKKGPNVGPDGIMSLDSAGGSYGSPGSGTGRDAPGGVGYKDRTPTVAAPGVRKQQLKDLIEKQDEEKYDSWEQMVQDKYPGQGLTTKTPHFNIQKSKIILGKARDDWNQVKDSMNEKYKKKVGGKIIQGLLGMGITFGISDIIGAMIDGYKTNKAKKEFISDIKNQIENYKDLGIPEYSPHTDTLIQTLNQEILDLTQKPDKEEQKDDRGVAPVPIPVVMEEMAGATGQIDMFDAWGEIKRKQALRASLFADEDQAKVGDWVGDQRLLVNSGGLANLFRVKNQ
jgi:hypothetical protein